MHILGNTLREITTQKIGIVHEHNPVIMYRQAAEVNEVAEDWVKDYDAQLIMTTEDAERHAFEGEFAADMPQFQQRNWLLAYVAYRFLEERDGLSTISAELLLGTQALQVPGRMDRRRVGGKVIVMDGAHNGQKMETFLQSFTQTYPDVKPAVLIALKEGKEPAAVAPLLAPLASEIIITMFNTSQDLPAVSTDPTELAEIFKAAGAEHTVVEPDQLKAYDGLLASNASVCIITGSFYLLSQLRDKQPLLQHN
jgi:dihydrofolate synthase/folylpolyglutamate synthase